MTTPRSTGGREDGGDDGDVGDVGDDGDDGVDDDDDVDDVTCYMVLNQKLACLHEKGISEMNR